MPVGIQSCNRCRPVSSRAPRRRQFNCSFNRASIAETSAKSLPPLGFFPALCFGLKSEIALDNSGPKGGETFGPALRVRLVASHSLSHASRRGTQWGFTVPESRMDAPICSVVARTSACLCQPGGRHRQEQFDCWREPRRGAISRWAGLESDRLARRSSETALCGFITERRIP